METPFVFGKIASEKNFTNRKSEIEKLVMNFVSLVNTVLISPRRYGKSSLVLKASRIAAKKNSTMHFCFIDLNNVRTEEQFYEVLATEVLRVMSKKTQVLLDNAKKFLGKFIPNITISPGPGSEFKLSLDWEEVKKQPDEILDLAENLCKSKNRNLIICIDEFQNISEFEDPVGIQKKMRSHWQKHKKVAYCLYGSKRHMLMDVFTSPSMPFYKFGDVFFIEKISSADWIKFIIKRFKDTDKQIGEAEAALIADLAECHSYYVQQLAQQSWLRTDRSCNSEIIRKAFSDLVLQLSMLFQNLTDNLSNTQINFLKALSNNEEQLSSQKVIREYQLGTSANVVRIKKTLVFREVIDIQNNKIIMLDPLYKSWLREYFFKL